MKYPVVNHINENRLDNRVEYLEWVTYKNNYNKFLKNNVRKVKPSEYHEEDLLGEKWLSIKDCSKYVISSHGRIMNKKTKRIMKTDNKYTYERITLLDDNNNKKHYQVHRLVYMTFSNDYDLKGYIIDHVDNNPKNNSYQNLQKITQSENTKRQSRFSKNRSSTTIPKGSTFYPREKKNNLIIKIKDIV